MTICRKIQFVTGREEILFPAMAEYSAAFPTRLTHEECYVAAVSDLLIGLLGALLATNQPAAVSNLVTQTTGMTVSIPDPNDPVEKEYHKVTTDDDAAQAEVDGWIRDNEAFSAKGGGMKPNELNAKIRTRMGAIKQEYVDFLAKHPGHARAHLAYGSFLNDFQDEEGAMAEFEKARTLDPSNPAPWNQLANEFTHSGPVDKAFAYYEKAIELNSNEPIYYQNLATTVYLFRSNSVPYYHLTEQQVYDKAMTLYEKAMKLDPHNFELAQDAAQTYYGIKPTRTDDALNAWTNALKIADTDIEREGVYLHFARFQLSAGRFAEAHRNLDLVKNPTYNDLKTRLERNLAAREKEYADTNAVKLETK
jgi:tetratricopeptide (TPR) repeat protein